MKKEKEEKLKFLISVAYKAKDDLESNEAYKDYEVYDVIDCGKITLTDKRTKETKVVQMTKVILKNPEKENEEPTIKTYFDLDEIGAILRNYEIGEPIKDEIGAEKDEDKKPDTLKKLQEEKEKEELNDEKEEEKDVDDGESEKEEVVNKKRKPKYVIETINPDEAKMDYWNSIRRSFGLPDKVKTLAFAYPDSKENKINYSNITIYMLDKDGHIIDDLNVDDYFEFDASTGNNPFNDDTNRLEEDEKKGNTQLNEEKTMIRLYAKQGHETFKHNTFLSIEQKGDLGDENDVYGGRKVYGTTDNMEKQLETQYFKVWDEDLNRAMSPYRGEDATLDMYREAEFHDDFEDEDYIDNLDSDGRRDTFECTDHINFKELATKWGYYKDGKPDEEKAKNKFVEYKEENPDLDVKEVIDGISDELYEQMPGMSQRH